MANERIQGAGGTTGGIGMFLIGLGMAIAGGWLLTNQVTVTSSSWRFGSFNGFGLSLIPLVLGIGILFFRPTSLFNTILMLVLLAGGIGLVARSLRAR
jgi:hypothetical protein